jgi:hypothetical protein
MELMKRVYMGIARGNIDLKVTREEFLQATQSYAQITPYEANKFCPIEKLNLNSFINSFSLIRIFLHIF